eukprot:8443-Heterococcus_DN1.PRE.1
MSFGAAVIIAAPGEPADLSMVLLQLAFYTCSMSPVTSANPLPFQLMSCVRTSCYAHESKCTGKLEQGSPVPVATQVLEHRALR